MKARREIWVLVAAGFHNKGGMDRCNRALAHYLAMRGDDVHLVSHEVDSELRGEVAGVHLVPAPAGSFMLGGLPLARRGRNVAAHLMGETPGARVVVNGGNCMWPDINWVHYVNAAWSAGKSSSAWISAKDSAARWFFLRAEQAALRGARILIANSERTRRDLIEHLHIDGDCIYTVYPGSDPRFRPAAPQLRAAARAWLGQANATPLVAFIGALGHDARKGFDVLFSAWKRLSAQPGWDANLIVAGGGRAIQFWVRQVKAAGLDKRVKILGFTNRIPELLAAADLLVSPARYESYGLNVHEAICGGVPAMVSRSAGVAERYPPELQDLLIDDPENAEILAARLMSWRMAMAYWRDQVGSFSRNLRSYTLEDMAEKIVSLCTGQPHLTSHPHSASNQFLE
jgi:glycosyltransferase involved in cell wall biosynthesis